MRIAVLTTDQPNERALCWKLAAEGRIAGVVCAKNIRTPNRRWRWARWRQRVANRTVGAPFVSAWAALQRRYAAQHPGWLEAPRLAVRNVNDAQTLAFLDRIAPDFVLVSGTTLLGPALLSQAPRWRALWNLHTGLSPYVKGGPNCTNWCLASGALHLIGNTIMWLDAGVDSGPIVASERAPLTGRETLPELHWAVMEHAHDLSVRAVRALLAGRSVPRVPQASLGDGRTFRNGDWTAAAMRRAWAAFRRDYRPEALAADGVRVVPLESGCEAGARA